MCNNYRTQKPLCMEDIYTKYLNLIFKRLTGQITPEQEQDLESWLSKSPENQRIYQEQKEIYKLTGSVDKSIFDIDVNEEWERFHKKLARPKVVDFYSILRPVVAAAALVALFFTFWFLLGPKKTYKAGQGIKQIELADKSVVKLRPQSKLILERGFNRQTRTVRLEGEAYFVVLHDNQRPFRVKVNGFVVQDVGTEFFVSQKKDQVIVSKGLVKVQTRRDQKFVKAGQRVVIIKSKILKTQLEDKNLLGWATGEFDFDNEPLNSVFDILEQNYNVKFNVHSKAIDSLRITATFKDKNLEFILRVISHTENIHITQTKPKVYDVR